MLPLLARIEQLSVFFMPGWRTKSRFMKTFNGRRALELWACTILHPCDSKPVTSCAAKSMDQLASHASGKQVGLPVCVKRAVGVWTSRVSRPSERMQAENDWFCH